MSVFVGPSVCVSERLFKADSVCVCVCVLHFVTTCMPAEPVCTCTSAFCSVCVCVLTCLLAHVCGQMWRTRAEVIVAVGQQRCQRMHPMRLLYHRDFVGLLKRHNNNKKNEDCASECLS